MCLQPRPSSYRYRIPGIGQHWHSASLSTATACGNGKISNDLGRRDGSGSGSGYGGGEKGSSSSVPFCVQFFGDIK